MSEEPLHESPDLIEEQLLGRPASMGRREVSRAAEVSMGSARKFWHAMGFQIVEDEDPMFTEADLAALVRVSRIVREREISEELALAMTRAFARTADRLAVWQTQLVAEYLTPNELEAPVGETDARWVESSEVAEETARRLTDLADELEPLLVYVWRRHLASAIARMLADATPPEDASTSLPHRVVGFADLVAFTSLVRRMTERQLATLVQRFERLASDVITTHGGRVIKTVGDEVLFVHTDAAPAAAIALDLVDAMEEDDLLPEVRVGMAYGPVVSRLGDVFGMTVNRASRLTAVTPPGRVHVDDTLAGLIETVSGFRATPQRRRTLRGIGQVTPFELHRTSGARGSERHELHP